MITGYNTDVQHTLGVVHVQTEDKGLKNPVVESLLYVGGQVVAARRSSYRDLLGGELDELELAQRMDRQHREMIAAIHAGTYDEELAKMFGKAAGGEAEAEQTEETGPSLDQVILDYLDSESEKEQLEITLEIEANRDRQTTYLVVHAFKASTEEPVGGATVSARLISTEAEPVELGRGVTAENGMLELGVRFPPHRSGTAALIVEATSAVGEAEIKHLL